MQFVFSQNTRFTLFSSDKPQYVHTSSLNVAVHESSTSLVPCDSEGVPKETTFHWVLNNSGIEETLRKKTSTLTLRQAKLRFPEDEKYVGLLECRATNSVGEAKEPCTFQLVAAGKNWTFGCDKNIFWFCILSTVRS